MSTLAPLLQAFFTERLIGQLDASPHTVASYRDAICLLLRFAQQRTGRAPHQLDLDDLDAPLIGAFLNYLEVDRSVSVRTRNARLTAIRSLFAFAAYRYPEHAAVIQRVLAIPPKRTDRAVVTYLTDTEMQALLDAPDRATRIGRRDHALLLLDLETGLRVSELTALTCDAVHLDTAAHVRCHGKGRKERITPLRRETRTVLKTWLTERAAAPNHPLFPGPRGGTPQPRRRAAPHRPSRRDRNGLLPVAREQARQPAHPAAQLRDEPPTPWRRRRHHRALAGTRRRPHHLRRLPARRPQPERESPRTDRPAEHTIGPLPATRPDP